MSDRGSGRSGDGNPVPRAAERLLRLLLPEDEVEPVLGDLEEEFASNVAKVGNRQATRMYWKEATAASLHAAGRRAGKNRASLIVIGLGAIGGALMIASFFLSTPRDRMFLADYVALMFIVGVSLRWMRVGPFVRRFRLCVGSFMTATLAMYPFIANNPSISLFGHAWRIGLMLAIGSAVALLIAALTSEETFPAFPITYVPVLTVSYLFTVHARAGKILLLKGILPFSLIGHPPRHGWWWLYWAFDVLLWAALGLIVARAVRMRQRPRQAQRAG